MKSITSLFLALLLCIFCIACAEAPNQPAESEQPASTSDTVSSTQMQAVFAVPDPASPVRIELDGQPIGWWSDLLYQIYDGVVHDGSLMFENPPFEKIPCYTMENSLRILINGEEKETVTVRDPDTGSIVLSGRPTAALKDDLAAGTYLIAFDFRDTTVGVREGDCRVTSYYFYLTVPEGGSGCETTTIGTGTETTYRTEARCIHSFTERDAGDGVTYHECEKCGYWYYSYGGGTMGWMSDANTTAVM